MMDIMTFCTFCRSEVETTKEWLIENHILFCNTCCKSFTPKSENIYEIKRVTTEKNDLLESVDSDKDEYLDAFKYSMSQATKLTKEEINKDEKKSDDLGLQFVIRDDNIIDDDTF